LVLEERREEEGRHRELSSLLLLFQKFTADF
jgi:hypothetical protein